MIELFETRRLQIADLVPHVRNPRKIKQEEKKKLWERLQKYGMIGIPVMDADGTLLSGHQRCELYAQYGFGATMIDVRVAVRKLEENELREIMIIENSHAGEFDLKMLQAEFEQYVNLDDFGISFAELEKQLEAAIEPLESKEVEMPIVPKFSEKYSAFIIVCTNEIDENNVAEKLGIERMQCYKSSKVGQSHVITAKQFSERWSSK